MLPVEYFHAVFTLPARIAGIAFQNKAAAYGLLVKVSSQTLLTIAAGPKHPGVKTGMTSVLQTWGSAMTHHPHVHVFVPGGGLPPDGTRWSACRPGGFPAGEGPVEAVSALWRDEQTRIPSLPIPRRCAKPTGPFMPNRPSAGRMPCLPM